jgi:uncharacterized membrane-anchored protein
MNRRSINFLVVVGLQFAILLSVIGFKQYTVWTGETVLLKVQPLDPRSLFHGDYVHLNYTISTLDPRAIGGGAYFYGSDTIWVELAPGEGGYWQAVGVYRDRRDVLEGHILLKGKVEEQSFRDQQIRVKYGIEDVFVPEGSGRAVERAQATLGVEVKVDRFGNAVPRRILLDGQPFKLKRRT